jgi:elongation factor P--beta-lysine ligase
MGDYQIEKLKRIIAFMDKTISDNNRLIEAQRNRPVFKERAEAYADGIDLANGDLLYIRKWLGEVLSDE